MARTINNSINVDGLLDNGTEHDKVLNKAVLRIKNLKVWYRTYRGNAEVVDGVNINVGQGEKIGLVGESGCGKTTTMKTVLRTINPSQVKIPEGEILFQEKIF
ncbi:MAG: ATP-binding cassette domain-containing protein [Clostridia bacterium]